MLGGWPPSRPNVWAADGTVDSTGSCRSKRVNDDSRVYAKFRDFRGARVSTLTLHVLKPNADPVVLT